MESMSAQDAMFLHVENDVTPMHIGGVSIFEGPPPPFEELSAMVESKLHLTPRYRQKVRFVPLGMGAPVWVDDPHFNIDYHLRHSAVPAPGSETQLRAIAARVFSQHLDRAQAAVGDLDGRGARRGPLGAALQGPPLHGRRGRRDRPDVGDVRRSDPSRRPATVWQPDPEPSGMDLSPAAPRQRVRDPAAQVRVRAAGAERGAAERSAMRRAPWRPPRRPCAPDLVADGPDRPTPRLELGEGRRSRRRQGGALRARRDGQRRRARR